VEQEDAAARLAVDQIRERLPRVLDEGMHHLLDLGIEHQEIEGVLAERDRREPREVDEPPALHGEAERRHPGPGPPVIGFGQAGDGLGRETSVVVVVIAEDVVLQRVRLREPGAEPPVQLRIEVVQARVVDHDAAVRSVAALPEPVRRLEHALVPDEVRPLRVPGRERPSGGELCAEPVAGERPDFERGDRLLVGVVRDLSPDQVDGGRAGAVEADHFDGAVVEALPGHRLLLVERAEDAGIRHLGVHPDRRAERQRDLELFEARRPRLLDPRHHLRIAQEISPAEELEEAPEVIRVTRVAMRPALELLALRVGPLERDGARVAVVDRLLAEGLPECHRHDATLGQDPLLRVRSQHEHEAVVSLQLVEIEIHSNHLKSKRARHSEACPSPVLYLTAHTHHAVRTPRARSLPDACLRATAGVAR
jgi:hypothetical protein